MTDYTVHDEFRIIGGAVFNLSLRYQKGRGYYATVTPGRDDEHGFRYFMPISAERVCLQETTRTHRFNRKKAEALIPQAKEAYRKLILKIVRKEVSDLGLRIGIEAIQGANRFDGLMEKAGVGEIPSMPFPAQTVFLKCSTLLETVLDGKMTVPALPTEVLGHRYGSLLMFLEPFEDAKRLLIEAGKTFGDEVAAGLIQQWEGLSPSDKKTEIEELLIELLMFTGNEDVKND